jgi:hypothetical protein
LGHQPSKETKVFCFFFSKKKGFLAYIPQSLLISSMFSTMPPAMGWNKYHLHEIPLAASHWARQMHDCAGR